MTRRLAAAAALALLAFCYHIPAAIQNLRFLTGEENSIAPPFELEPLRPVIEDFRPGERPPDLFVTDRILSINGEPIDSASTLGRLLREMPPEAVLTMLVEHYPPGGPSWRQLALVPAQAPDGARLRFLALFFGIVFPALCVLLGFAVLAVNALETRAWLTFGVLLFGAQMAVFSRANPDSWPLALALPAELFHDLGSWTGPIWVFLFLLDARRGKLPKLRWFHWLPITVAGAAALILTLGSLGASLNYALVEPLSPIIPFTAWLAIACIYASLSIFLLGFIFGLGKCPRTARATFRNQRIRLGVWLTFGPMVAAFGPHCVGLGQGFDPSSAPLLWALFWGSFVFLPLFLAFTEIFPPSESLRTSIRYRLARTAPWLGRILDPILFPDWLRAEREIEEICSAIPRSPISLDFLNPVAAGIARVLASGRVVVFGKSEGKFAPLASFGYMRPVEYDFRESGSLAQALRKEISTGRQDFDWTAATDEELKLRAMKGRLYVPFALAGELGGFFVLAERVPREPSGAETRLLAPLAQRTAYALSGGYFASPGPSS
jgi:hypothetical protein